MPERAPLQPASSWLNPEFLHVTFEEDLFIAGFSLSPLDLLPQPQA
jgi:hypothetical protein